jgi:hypothetical protein
MKRLALQHISEGANDATAEITRPIFTALPTFQFNYVYLTCRSRFAVGQLINNL